MTADRDRELLDASVDFVVHEAVSAGRDHTDLRKVRKAAALRAIASARTEGRREAVEEIVAFIKDAAKQQSAAEADWDDDGPGQVTPSHFAWEIQEAIARGDHLSSREGESGG